MTSNKEATVELVKYRNLAILSLTKFVLLIKIIMFKRTRVCCKMIACPLYYEIWQMSKQNNMWSGKLGNSWEFHGSIFMNSHVTLSSCRLMSSYSSVFWCFQNAHALTKKHLFAPLRKMQSNVKDCIAAMTNYMQKATEKKLWHFFRIV